MTHSPVTSQNPSGSPGICAHGIPPTLIPNNPTRKLSGRNTVATSVASPLERHLGSIADVTDMTGGGDHFRATVIAAEFADLSRIEQHRRVYAVFGPEIGGPIHALSLVTKAE